MKTAARWASWIDRGLRTTPGLAASASAVGGIPILQQQFGDLLHLVVEIAWGAMPGTDPATWGWTDVTSDVQVDNGKQITITPGRADEASTTQPASMTLTLDNRLDRYSVEPLSPNWPNVRRNVPIRVRALYQGTPFTRFQGGVTGFTPQWDTTGNYAVVAVQANGTLRRIAQGTATLRSPLERAVISTDPVAYWPMEDGSSAIQVVSPIAGVPPMVFTGLNLASNSGLSGSAALPTFTATGQIQGTVPTYTPTLYWEVHWYQQFMQPLGDTVVLHINSTGTYKTWEVVAQGTVDSVGPSVTLNVYNASGTKTTVFSNVVFPLFYTTWAYCKIFLSESAGTVTWTFEILNAATAAGNFESNTYSGTAGITTSIATVASTTLNGLSVGHVSVWTYPPNLSVTDPAAGGFFGEQPPDRINRLCAEQGESVTVNGTSVTLMGTQAIDTFINILRAAELRDDGVLYDGFGPGLSYISRDLRENAPITMVLDASAGDVSPPFAPVHDDQLLRNDYVATRSNNGATVEYMQTDGSLTPAQIGLYTSSGTVDCQYDSELPDFASWQVHKGQITGYRYPNVVLWLHKSPNQLLPWLNQQLFLPFRVANIHAVRSQMANANIDLMLEGYTETIDRFTWSVSMNCSPNSVWMIGTIAAETGDTSPYVLRLESDGSFVAATVAPGASSISVNIPSGPLWTTNSDDFPLYIAVGDLLVTVTSISGASSPQTFTVDPTTVTKQLPAGLAITIASPLGLDAAVLGL